MTAREKVDLAISFVYPAIDLERLLETMVHGLQNLSFDNAPSKFIPNRYIRAPAKSVSRSGHFGNPTVGLTIAQWRASLESI